MIQFDNPMEQAKILCCQNPIKTLYGQRQKCEAWLYLGVFLLNLLFIVICLSTFLFAFQIPITKINLPIALIIDAIILYFLAGRSQKKIKTTIVIGTLLVVATVILCMCVYDWTWDGNTYHKLIVGLLRYGWNPLYKTYIEYGGDRFSFLASIAEKDLFEAWLNGATKGSEIWGACVYAICNNIEGGKSYNLISMIGSFCVCFGLLGWTQIIKLWQVVLCVFFCVVTPVSLSQCFTYYVDGFLWQLMTVCLAALLYLTFYEYSEHRKIAVYLVFISINVGLNIKLSGSIFFGILGILIFVLWSVERLLRNGNITDTRCFIKKKLILLGVSAITGFFITGATSYGINTFRYKNPFYSMLGEKSTSLADQVPNSIKGMSNIKRVIISLFSRTNNNKSAEIIELKYPLFFDGSEFSAAQIYDTRLAGWGIFFSGLFLISIVIIIWWLIKKDRFHRIKKYIVVFLVAYLISLFCIPYLFWARYNAAMFYFPAAGLLILFVTSKDTGSSLRICMASVMCALFVLNIIPNVTKNISEFKKYKDYHNQLIRLCEQMREVETVIGTDRGDFQGRLFSLMDQGITEINYVGVLQQEEIDGTVFSPYGINFQFVSSPLGAKTLEEFLDCVKQNDFITLIAVSDEGSKALTNDSIQKARALGLKFELANGGYRKSYCAILDGRTVLEEGISDQKLSYTLVLDGHDISLTSAGYEVGQSASIQVDGVEYALNRRGINIVLINRETWNIVDSVCVDSYLDNKVNR